MIDIKEYKGMGSTDVITVQNYKDYINKIGISKLTDSLKKGHQFLSKNIDVYHSDSSIKETINDYINDLNNFVSNLPKSRQKAIFTKDDSYSGYKFVGRKYKQTENMKISEIAKLVKKELDIRFGDVAKFSVVSDVYTGGASINVTITDITGFNPFTETYTQSLKNNELYEDFYSRTRDEWNRVQITTDELKKIIDESESVINQYRMDDSDSMIDYFHSNFYGFVRFDDSNYKKIHFPNHPEVIRQKKWDDNWNQKKEQASIKAKANKGKFKKGEIVLYFNEHMHKSWHKYALPNGLYLAKVIKSPNGRALFSYYTISILKSAEGLSEEQMKYREPIETKFGKFVRVGTISPSEESLFPLEGSEKTISIIKARLQASKYLKL